MRECLSCFGTVEKQEKIHILLGQIDEVIVQDNVASTESVEFTPGTLISLIGELNNVPAAEP